MRPLRILDLFCGAGFAGMGYAVAGWEVVGVDIEPQPRYPFPFIQHDALTLDPRFLAHFDAIHASPPCLRDTVMKHAKGAKGDAHPDLVPVTAAMLRAQPLPYVLENVESPSIRATFRDPIRLCGSGFDLGAAGFQLQRHRLFEVNFPLTFEAPGCNHQGPTIGIYGGHVRNRAAKNGGRGTRDFVGYDKPRLAKEAFGLEPDAPFTMAEISQGIPPAYTMFFARNLALHIRGMDEWPVQIALPSEPR